jgi:malonyl-CoA decarboxylase
VFYSISNCQPGLRGITFGSFLIKQVVEELTRERPRLATFVTLSPVPGFARWLDRERRAENSRALDAATRDALAPLDVPDWAQSPAARAAAEPALASLAAYYFLRAKTSEQRPVDPVARFHLGNGARLERINTGADLSPKGLREAHGLMVNYRYIPDDIEKNHESYARTGEVVCTAAVRRKLPAHAGAGDLVPAS